MVGIRFADPRKVKKIVRSMVVDNMTFKIPPGNPRYEVSQEHVISKDMLILSMLPHMHLRGKSFRYEAVYPDGAREVLLDVPNYDFNWQLRYVLAEPKLMPKGTRLHCIARFDNSADNPDNPDPTKTVGFGLQSTDEMMQGLYSSVDAGQDVAAIALVALSLVADSRDKPAPDALPASPASP